GRKKRTFTRVILTVGSGLRFVRSNLVRIAPAPSAICGTILSPWGHTGTAQKNEAMVISRSFVLIGIVSPLSVLDIPREPAVQKNCGLAIADCGLQNSRRRLSFNPQSEIHNHSVPTATLALTAPMAQRVPLTRNF